MEKLVFLAKMEFPNLQTKFRGDQLEWWLLILKGEGNFKAITNLLGLSVVCI